MMKRATAPIMEPTAMDPAASYIGLPVTCVSAIAPAATPTPTTATESSSSTAGLSGSGPSTRYCRMDMPCFFASRRTSVKATERVYDSIAPATPRTATAVGKLSSSPGCISS